MNQVGDSQVKVSIICNAYNHEKYIKKCLDGLVMQKTTFSFEILVHDDASTDKTADIIRTYEVRYPDLVKPIYQVENQYSKGGTYRFQYPRAKGKYIAICEGDDFWTDELKLQKQYDALEAHPDVDICAHAAAIVSENDEIVTGYISPRKEKCIIPVESVIYGGGAFVATNSLMYRAFLKDSAYRFRSLWRIDYTLQILGSLQGGMLFLPETMSAYRWMAVGSWSSQQGSHRDKRKTILDKSKIALESLNEETAGKYAKTIARTILRDEFVFYYMYGPYKVALSKKYKEFRKKWGVKKNAKLYAKVMFPFFFKKK